MLMSSSPHRCSVVRIRCLAVVVAMVCAFLIPGVAAASPSGIEGTNGAPVPELEWGSCPAGSPEEEEFLRPYRCATAEVPLSYRHPEGQSIELALGLLPASDQANKIGTLFWNPGGPGGSGRIPFPFTEALHERFDLVGFDPRGVAASTPVQCFQSNEQAFQLLGWDFPITPAQEQRVIELSRRATKLCARNGGPLLEHMSTANVARDLDLLREAVGDERLTYLGFSYGTHLGEVYANLFPGKVRALTLDAVLDPVEWTTGDGPGDSRVPVTYRIGSHVGAEDALTTFLAACEADERCAFREEGVDLRKKFNRLLSRVRRRPVTLMFPEGEFIVTYQVVVYVTLGSLYSPFESPYLAEALQQVWVATEQRTAPRLRASLNVRQLLVQERKRPILGPVREDEPYAGLEWFPAVLCTDTDNPRNPWVWPRYARRADREGYPFGSPWVYYSLPCATWPARDDDRYTGPWDRATANPVLLVGNRLGDPATPYDDAVRTATERLANARLLTVNTFGHTALGQSTCGDEAIERYFIHLQLPDAGSVCQPDRAPFDPLPDEPPIFTRR